MKVLSASLHTVRGIDSLPKDDQREEPSMSFVRRFLAGFTAITAIVLGLSLTTAGTAAAADGVWNHYGGTNPITSSPSTWKCNETRVVDTNVVAQVCAVRSESGTSTQAAVIVRNNRSSTYSLSASTSLYVAGEGLLATWDCPRSGVAKNSWSVCFGRTIGESYLLVYAKGYAGGAELGLSPRV